MAAKRARTPVVSPKPAPQKPLSASPRWLKPTMLALTATVLMAWFSAASGANDVFWHLKSGQYIVQHHALPVPDPFAFTTYLGTPSRPGEEITRRFNLVHEWLAQVIGYLVYAAAGFPGLVLLRAALVAFACGMVGLVAYHRSKRFYLALGATFAAASIVRGYAVDRPYLATLVMVAVTIAILEYRRGLWLLPPLFLIWANCHAGFFMGWVLLGIYCAEALFERWRGQPQAEERRLWIVAAVAILASGLNPNGFRVIETLFYYRSSPMLSSLGEWRPARLWPLDRFVALVFLAGAALVYARGKARVADWLLFLIFTVACLNAVRNVMLMALVGPILIAGNFPWKKLALPAAADYAVSALIVAGGAFSIAQGKTFQLYAMEEVRPAGAVSFLQEHHITAPMFNTFEHGGYLIWKLWPQERVFIDGRALNETVYQDNMKIAYNSAEAQRLLDQYGIQVIVIDGFEYHTGSPHLLMAALADPRQTKWKLVYQDNTAVVFMREPPPGTAALDSRLALSSMEAQCTEHIRLVPDQPFCARSLGQLFSQNDPARARKWMAFYLANQAEPDPQAERVYGQMLAAGK
jgi:hypothetical protein